MIIVVDYPSIQDVKENLPVSGYPAKLLKVAARYAHLGQHEFVSLFPHPPRVNNPSSFFHPSKGAPDEAIGNPKHKQLGYLRSEYIPDYHRVRNTLKNGNLVLAMGDLAFWTLTGEKLSDHRGTIVYSSDCRVIGTHHPRALVKDHSLLPVLAMDLKKAWAESQKPTSTFPRRTINIVETVEDAKRAEDAILAAGSFAFDIETHQQQITMICFATSPTQVYVFPLVEPYATWSDITPIRNTINTLMSSSCNKLAHNAVYDLTYLTRWGINIKYPVDDTMLLSHSHEIEWPKSLGFLGSIYCNEKSWKLLRIGKVKDRNKKDE
jgi:hypothetical protein